MSKENAGWKVSNTLIISVLAVAINYIITFALTPYITNYIGTEAYGFVSLAKTISNYGIVVTSCLNAYASRFITLAYHERNVKEANTYFSSIVIANLGLLGLSVVFDVFFIINIQSFIIIPIELVGDVKILFAIDIFNYMLLAFANTFTCAAYIKNRLYIAESIKFVAYLIEAAILIILFSFFDPKVYYVGIALVVTTIFLGFMNYLMARKLTPDLCISKQLFSWQAVKDLVLSGIWNSINSIGNMLNSGLDLWVSDLLLSALAMGQLSIVKTISTIFSTLLALLSRPFQPYLLKKYANKDIDGVIAIYNFEIKFSGFITNILFASLYTYGMIYYKLWTPNQDIQLLYNVTFITILGFLFEGMIQPLFYTYTLTLKNKIPCVVTIISGLLNVLGMYVLLKYTNLGLYAVVGTTTVLGFFTYMIFTPLYAARCLKMKWYVFYPSMIRVLISALLITLVMKFTSMIYMPTGWLSLIVVGIIGSIIGAFIHCLCVFSIKDFKWFLRRIQHSS